MTTDRASRGKCQTVRLHAALRASSLAVVAVLVVGPTLATEPKAERAVSKASTHGKGVAASSTMAVKTAPGSTVAIKKESNSRAASKQSTPAPSPGEDRTLRGPRGPAPIRDKPAL